MESARQVLYAGRLQHRVAAVIDSFAEADEFDRMEKWLSPIRAALLGLSVVQLRKELLIRVARADALENIAREEFALAWAERPRHCDAVRRQLINRLREQQATGMALLMALLRDDLEQAA